MSLKNHGLPLIFLVTLVLTCVGVSGFASVLDKAGEALSGSPPAKGGVENPVPGTPPTSEEEVIEARASFRKQYRFPPESHDLNAAQTRKVRLVYAIDLTLSEQIDALRQLAKLKRDIRNNPPPEKWESVASIPELSSPQITLKTLDSLYAVRNDVSRSGERARQETKRADQNLDLATQSYENAEKQRRDFEDPSGVEESNRSIVTDRETATLASQAAEAKLALRRLQSRLAQAESTLIDTRIKRFQPFLATHRLRVVLPPELLQEQLDAFSAKETDLEKSLLASQAKLDQLTPEDPVDHEPEPADVTPDDTVRQLAQSYRRNAAQAQVSLNQAWINHLNIQRQFYCHRIDFYQNKLTRRQITEITRELDLEIQRLQSEADYLRNRMEQARQDADRIGDQFSETKGLSPQRIQSLQDAAREVVEALRRETLSVDFTLSQLGHFNDELHDRSFGYSWREIRAVVGDRLSRAWNFRLFILNDKEFRISTLFWLLFLVAIGFFSARYISRAAGSLLTSKTHLAPGVSAAYEKLILYFLVVVICFFIFNLFKFSLTSLTVVGGIFAVAVGFGSQEVFKNFISGIIILVERPVHKGDLIELEGRILEVQSIGLRSTQVLDLDNSQKIVPNSLLLESVITNWTLSDNILRSTIQVGVAYGSPTRKTADVLLEAMRSTEGVLTSPEPLALFSEFGDSALGFTLYFWTHTADRLKISSEARHRMMEALAAENIPISFPQRDVHLDSLNPLRVELSRPLSSPPKEGAGTPRPADPVDAHQR